MCVKIYVHIKTCTKETIAVLTTDAYTNIKTTILSEKSKNQDKIEFILYLKF